MLCIPVLVSQSVTISLQGDFSNPRVSAQFNSEKRSVIPTICSKRVWEERFN